MKRIILNSIKPECLFEKDSLRGAFGLPTDAPMMKSQEKRSLGRWDPLTGDKFIKSKLGKVLHKPIPGTPRIGSESDQDI